MRLFRFAALPIALIASGCTQAPPRLPASAPVAKRIAARVAAPVIAEPAKILSSAARPPKLTQQEISGISFEGVAFDSSIYRLAVVDQPGGPGSRFADAQSAGSSRDGIAAVNAGFFTPEGTPLGKLIAAGTPAGSWNRASSLGSGIFYESPAGNLALARRESVSPNAAQSELIQAGPLLIENGQTVSGLNADKAAVRVFILWDGGSRWWIGRGSSCTLAELGKALRQASPSGFPIHSGLNLDGGRSADLWISGSVPGGPINERPMWNRPVRNFLVLVRR